MSDETKSDGLTNRERATIAGIAAPGSELAPSRRFIQARIDKGAFPAHVSRDGTAHYGDGSTVAPHPSPVPAAKAVTTDLDKVPIVAFSNARGKETVSEAAARDQAAAVEAATAQLRAERDRLQVEVHRLAGKCDGLVVERDLSKGRAAEMEDNYDAANETIKGLRELRDEKDRRIAELEEQAAAVEAATARLRGRVADLEAEVGQVNAVMAERMLPGDTTAESVARLARERDANAKRISELEDERARLRKEIREATAALDGQISREELTYPTAIIEACAAFAEVAKMIPEWALDGEGHATLPGAVRRILLARDASEAARDHAAAAFASEQSRLIRERDANAKAAGELAELRDLAPFLHGRRGPYLEQATMDRDHARWTELLHLDQPPAQATDTKGPTP